MAADPVTESNINIHSFLEAGGEMGKRTREYDWAATSIGPVESWPQSLRTILSILLNAKYPMFLWWGEDLVQFYNDAYRPSLGIDGKHPTALGQKGVDCWPEIWPIIKPLIDQVLAGGEATWSEDQLIPIYRNGRLEDVYWTFSYSPVKGEEGNVQGVLVICNETTESIKSLHKLQISEKRFQNLVQEATVGIVVLSGEEMRVDIVNEMYGRLINLTPADLLGKPLFDLIPDAAEPFLPLLKKVLTTGEPLYLYDQPYFVNVNGEKIYGYLNVVYQPYRESDGTITGVMALCHDITEEVKIRREIEESELFAKNIIKDSEAAQIVWLGKDMVFDMVNEKMLEILGRDVSIIGMPFMEAIPELKGTPLMERLHKVLLTGETYYQPEEMFVLMRHGKPHTGYYNYTYRALANASGENYGIMCTAMEVTEQVNNRKKIEQAEEKARLAIESADLGTYEINLATDEMITSERFKAIWGVDHSIPRAEFAGFIHPDDRPQRSKAHEDSLVTGNLHYEARILWKDGSEHWVKVEGKLIYDDNGKPITLLGVIQDITEQKQFAELLKEQVKERTLELQRSNEDLLQFAHVASHDLKEPVRKIKIFSNKLQDELGDILPEKAIVYLEKVQHASNRMFSMIDGVLMYSALSSSEQSIEKIDLNEVISNIETDLELPISHKQAIIIKNVLPVIEGASVLIYQLFYNLINNSLKFSKENEETIIHISSSLVTQGGENMVQVNIHDNGIGFEPEYAEKIFDTFARLNPKDKFEGTGLGLSLCKKIAERHGGNITATAVKDEGATFTLRLPLIQKKKNI